MPDVEIPDEYMQKFIHLYAGLTGATLKLEEAQPLAAALLVAATVALNRP